MCVIVHVPAGEQIHGDDLKMMYEYNPDGCGLISASTGARKGLWDYDTLVGNILQIPKGEEYLLHLRIKTHGGITAENCHPFRIGKRNENAWLMHNGILNFPCINKNWSDTRSFAKHLQQYNSKEIIRSLEEIENTVQGNSKMAYYFNGKIILTGKWEWHMNVRVSNTYWDYNPVVQSVYPEWMSKHYKIDTTPEWVYDGYKEEDFESQEEYEFFLQDWKEY